MANQYIMAYEKHAAAASLAYDAFLALCDGFKPARIPGMDTIIRMAWRIECGHTIESAAMREYVYRWNLASDRWRAFGAPHPFGL